MASVSLLVVPVSGYAAVAEAVPGDVLIGVKFLSGGTGAGRISFIHSLSQRIDMSASRRDFLAQSTLGLLSVAVSAQAQTPQAQEPTPGAPPAFGTAPPVGPEVSPGTFAEAEKLVRVEMTQV